MAVVSQRGRRCVIGGVPHLPPSPALPPPSSFDHRPQRQPSSDPHITGTSADIRRWFGRRLSPGTPPSQPHGSHPPNVGGGSLALRTGSWATTRRITSQKAGKRDTHAGPASWGLRSPVKTRWGTTTTPRFARNIPAVFCPCTITQKGPFLHFRGLWHQRLRECPDTVGHMPPPPMPRLALTELECLPKQVPHEARGVDHTLKSSAESHIDGPCWAGGRSDNGWVRLHVLCHCRDNDE